MKGINFGNKISAKCLVSGLGHDFVTITRDHVTSTESWMECWECGMSLDELDRVERECLGHTMKCTACGFPMMTDRRDVIVEDED